MTDYGTGSAPKVANRETWQITKAPVRGENGVVTSQHYGASEIGAQILRDGGNAVDAAVATGFAIGTMEPWMSGLGGGGHMVVLLAKESRAYAIDFGMHSPRGLDLARYSVVDGTDADLFGWPAVEDQRNVLGPHSIAVPGLVAGLGHAMARFGRLDWDRVLAGAIDSARAGMVVDWYATLKIAGGAPTLSRFDESARTYLPGGHVPAGEWGGPSPHIRLGNLHQTLNRLAQHGPRDFYHGELSKRIVDELAAQGSPIRQIDFEAYQPVEGSVNAMGYREAKVFSAPGLTAGPTLQRTLRTLAKRLEPAAGFCTENYLAYAHALAESYEHRLQRMGYGALRDDCTTHISVADGEGNVVALTQTLLSVFGSKLMLADTGLLMNNGIMWFDPRPGGPNSIAADRRPLSNMCPTVVENAPGTKRYALGASGGRRIMPAVAQLTSFLLDFGLDTQAAVHQPRIDVSGAARVAVDARLGAETVTALAREFPVDYVQHGVYPSLFACPNLASFDVNTGVSEGAAFVMSPWAAAVAA